MSKPPDRTNQHIKAPPAKVRAQKRGQWAEQLTAMYLCLTGHRVLARNFRTRVGEVDLIVRRGNILSFVEVKARSNITSAAEAISTRQRRRIQRAAELFLAQHPNLSTCDIRFDVSLVSGPLRFTIVRDAWRVDT